MIRVGINATSLNDRPSGARQRFIGLYGALFRLRPDNEYFIYEPRDCRVADWFSGLANVRGIATSLPSASRLERYARGIGLWRSLLARDGLTCFEALHLPLIRAPDCPTILTVHDARPVLDDVPKVRRAVYLHILRRALREADSVITVSHTMKRELLAIETTARITTIYNGIAPMPFAETRGGSSAKQTDTNLMLAVGHFEPRKNYETLIRAMALLAADPAAPRLAIVGKDGGSLVATRALIVSLGLTGRVDLMLDVDDARLGALYRAARLLIFSSTYEGFGIPVLEAMAAGLPMAVSDLPVFRELTEDRAAYFDPLDASAMAQTISSLLDSPHRQDEQRAYGHHRLADFAFPALARELDVLHHRVAFAGATGVSGR